MHDLHIHLVANQPELAEAWSYYFAEFSNITISRGNILSHTADAIVSPANSFGYMDGGIDLVYSQHFGWELERRLRERLIQQHDGELPVGQAEIVPTEHPDIPYLISAPTMRVPMNIEGTVNAYLAFRAVLRAVRAFNRGSGATIGSVLCPGLGTGEGRVEPRICAWQMYYAYAVCVLGRVERMGGLARAVENHIDLLGLPSIQSRVTTRDTQAQTGAQHD